jgi:hypothetical protein
MQLLTGPRVVCWFRRFRITLMPGPGNPREQDRSLLLTVRVGPGAVVTTKSQMWRNSSV